MAIGERIHFFRLLRGMTQKSLGMTLGFPETSADVRLAQYESGTRTPKADLTATIADTLDVSFHALSVPDIDSYVGLMHTLFTLEDRFVDASHNKDASELHKMLCSWQQAAAMLEYGEISEEDYNHWRYHYPDVDIDSLQEQGLSGELEDYLVSDFV